MVGGYAKRMQVQLRESQAEVRHVLHPEDHSTRRYVEAQTKFNNIFRLLQSRVSDPLPPQSRIHQPELNRIPTLY